MRIIQIHYWHESRLFSLLDTEFEHGREGLPFPSPSGSKVG